MDKEEGKSGNSYRYWVRDKKDDAAPLPVPKKLTDQEKNQYVSLTGSHLGSTWNKACYYTGLVLAFSHLEICFSHL